MISMGIDAGETHTDPAALDADGKVSAADRAKTIQAQLSRAVVQPIRDDFHGRIVALNLIATGTTAGTDASLERTLPEIALLTSRGFRDVPLMRRDTKAELTNPQREIGFQEGRKDGEAALAKILFDTLGIIKPGDPIRLRRVDGGLARATVTEEAGSQRG